MTWANPTFSIRRTKSPSSRFARGMSRLLTAAAAALLLYSSPLEAQETSTVVVDSVIYLERADRVEYLEKEKQVILTGNVCVRFETNYIYANHVFLDLEKELIKAEGDLVWKGEEHQATGSRMTFNVKTKEGYVENVTLTTGPWICRGQEIVQRQNEVVEVQPGIITTCDALKPHYHIRAKKIRIRLKRDLTAYQVTFITGSTPVLWLPVLTTPLREFRLPFEAQVGRTHELGPFVRTSPAYQLTPALAGKAHLDYFANKGWGYGVTQNVSDPKGDRIMRLHGYRIDERGTPKPGTPRRRWELYGEGSRNLLPRTRISGFAAYVSDAHFRELYGNQDLPVSNTAGERHATAMLSQQLPGANAAVMVNRTDTQRLSTTSLDSAQYALSSVHAPQVTVVTNPHPFAPWLSGTLKMEADRYYRWENGWYVNKTGLAPSLEIFGHLGLLGTVTITPRLDSTWRDRGDRILRVEDGELEEDINRGSMNRAAISSRLRTPLPANLEIELSHNYAKKLDKIGYDPFGYHGIESHTARGYLSARIGKTVSAGLGSGYDLRNRQDPSRRRWLPVVPDLTLTPSELVSMNAQAEFDVWHRDWRTASGTLRVGRESEGPLLRLRPSYTNNSMDLPAATVTSQEYLMARHLYGSSFQLASMYPRILLMDTEALVPLTSRLNAGFYGQYDFSTHNLRFYSVSLTRDLHCWNLMGNFQKFITGEYRFDASISLKAFPRERLPLIGL